MKNKRDRLAVIKFKDSDYIDNIINIDDLNVCRKLDNNLPFTFPVPLDSDAKKYLTVDKNNNATCSLCGMTFKNDDSNQVTNHVLMHKKYITEVNSKRAYGTKDEIYNTIKEALKIFTNPKSTVYEMQYTLYFYMLAYYSRHVLACAEIGVSSKITRDNFFKEMVLCFPERLPRKYIPYLIKTYADGEINYMCYRRYYGIPEDTPKRGNDEDEEFEEY